MRPVIRDWRHRLVDADEFVRLILDHYEKCDSKYKGLLPLKRVYAPERLEAEIDGE